MAIVPIAHSTTTTIPQPSNLRVPLLPNSRTARTD